MSCPLSGPVVPPLVCPLGGIAVVTSDRAEVFGGVDTHKHICVAAAVDGAGRLLGTAEFVAGWVECGGPVLRVGVEGTGSYGAGVARRLAAADVEAVEAMRPNRQTRRRKGKSDTVDAARVALGGDASVVAESADGCVEAIRAVGVARRSAVTARTVAPNQINAAAVGAPEGLQDQLKGLTTSELVKVCARLRPGTNSEPVTSATKKALRTPARRHQAPTADTADPHSELRCLCEQANPALLSACGVGVEVASSLLIAAGDNPEQMRSEASVAALCATSPIEASSGACRRHRLNRGANRCANNALWRIAMIRLRVDQKSIDYAARRTAEGKTRREILRCPKRHTAHKIYKLLTDPPEVPRGADLRQHRTQNGLTIQAVAAALNTAPTPISELERSLHHNRDLAQRYQQHLAQTPT